MQYRLKASRSRASTLAFRPFSFLQIWFDYWGHCRCWYLQSQLYVVDIFWYTNQQNIDGKQTHMQFMLAGSCIDAVLMSLCSLYLNPLSDAGKQSLYVQGVSKGHGGSGRRVKVLASVTEGSDISEDWHPILRVIRENASSWDREHVKEQLQVREALME